MPHVQRKRSESGFYHVVTKGDGGQVIFERESDRVRYTKLMFELVGQHKVELHAYCLMSNHVHFLLRDCGEDLSSFMKELDESYARYFAWMTGRVGHVFQGRFWSEPVCCDEHYLAALRYIHANPEPARMCQAKDYPWSSYQDYMGNTGCAGGRDGVGDSFGSRLVTTSFALDLLGGTEAFERFSQSGGQFAKPFRGSSLRGHLDPDELATVAVALLGRDNLNGLRAMRPADRRVHLARLSEAGFNYSEMARVTGIGQSSICRMLGNA